MDPGGTVGSGRVDESLLQPSPGSPFGTRLNPTRVLQAFDAAWTNRAVVLVEASDLARRRVRRHPGPAGATRGANPGAAGHRRARRCDRAARATRPPRRGGRGRAGSTVHRPRRAHRRRGQRSRLPGRAPPLTDDVADGLRAAHGRRTVGARARRARGPGLDARPAGRGAAGAGALPDRRAGRRRRRRGVVPRRSGTPDPRLRHRGRPATAGALLVLVDPRRRGAALLPAAALADARAGRGRLPRALLVPFHHLGPGPDFVFLAVAAVVLGGLFRVDRVRHGPTRDHRPIDALLAGLGALVGVLVLDVVTGGRLQFDSGFGFSPEVAGRFVGLGNIGSRSSPRARSCSPGSSRTGSADAAARGPPSRSSRWPRPSTVRPSGVPTSAACSRWCRPFALTAVMLLGRRVRVRALADARGGHRGRGRRRRSLTRCVPRRSARISVGSSTRCAVRVPRPSRPWSPGSST